MQGHRVATAISALLNPGLLLGGFVTALAAMRDPAQRRLSTAAVAFLFATVLPLASIVALWWRGAVSDLDLRVRQERETVYLACGISYACGAVVLTLLGARWSAGALLLVLVTVALGASLNRRLKVSIHAMTIAGVAGGALVVAGLRAWPVALALPVVAWARWAAGAHTPAELAAGTALGGAMATLGFAALSALLRR